MIRWINREDIDFDLASSLVPIQEWDLVMDPPPKEVIEYPTKVAKFNNVKSLIIHFPNNFGNLDVTRLNYIGLKGEFSELKTDPIITIYELNANPADHPKIKGLTDEVSKANF